MSLFGITFNERKSTFAAAWPYTKRADICTPDKLARAGFILYKGPPDLEIQCICCKGRISNLKADMDPWELHAQMDPRCTIIQLGKPEEPDGYTLQQLLKILEKAAISEQHEKYDRLNTEVVNLLKSVN